MTTIGDVAREAGVSRSTVSSVLTGKKYVRPQTRERIEQAIADLNFSVNSGARALATSRTMIIGVVVQLHGGEFGPALAPFLVALSDAARGEGYDVLLVTEQDASAAIHRLALERRVDGVVLLNVVDDDPRLPTIRAHDLPAVLLGMPRDPEGVDAVDLDFDAAARKLVRYLHDAGHRDALFVRWAPEMFAQRNSFVLRFNDAALAEAADLGMRLTPVDCPMEPEGVPQALSQALLDRGDATAVLIHDDAATALLPAALHTVGLEVPAGRLGREHPLRGARPSLRTAVHLGRDRARHHLGGGDPRPAPPDRRPHRRGCPGRPGPAGSVDHRARQRSATRAGDRHAAD